MSKPNEYLTQEEIKQAIDDMIAQNNRLIRKETALFYTKLALTGGLLICSTIGLLLLV